MNDEIKEILESLDKIAKAEYYPEDLLTYKECQLLLDYITNLQEENESLKIDVRTTEKNYNNFKDMYEKHIKEDFNYAINYQDYKSRCEKATEFIEKSRVKATPFFKQFDGDLIMPKREVDKLLIILNGGDE